MNKDITDKRLEEYNDVFADIFNNILFSGQEVLEEGELISLPTESFTRKSDGKLRQGNRDVCKADKSRKFYRLICGIENQQGKENTMPVRALGYDYASYEEQIQEIMEENKKQNRPAYTKRIHGDQKLAPVVTAVLHFGSEDWTSPLSLHDMLEFPEGEEELIKPLVPDYRINLIQMKKLPVEIRERLTSDFRMIAEYVACRNQPKKLDQFLSDNKYKIKHPEAFLDMLSEVSSDTRYRKAKELLTEKERKEGVTMCEGLDRLENRGVEKGIKQGTERGIYAMIQDNLNQGVSKEAIVAKLQSFFELTEEKALEYYNAH